MSMIATLVTFWRDRKGLSAIEFAILAPIMISFYFGGVEISDVMTVDRRVTTVASATADIVAQATQIDNTDIQDVFTAASSIMQPYNGAGIQIVVSSVADNNGVATVLWSDGFQTTPRGVGSTVTLPSGLPTPGGSVIMAEVTYVYDSPFADFYIINPVLTDTFYLKPRRVLQIPRIP